MRIHFFVFLLLCSCGREKIYVVNEVDREVQFESQMLYEVGCNMEKLGLLTVGFGHGHTEGHLKFISVSLQANEPLTIKSARRLAIQCIDNLLNSLNDKKGLGRYLTNWPYTSGNVVVMIIGSESANNDPDWILGVIVRGNIRYYGDNMTRLHVETFEEAVTILQRQEESDATPNLK